MTDSLADAIEVLVRRADVLRALSDGHRTKRELVDDVSVSRSTVDRAVRALESHGFVDRNDGVTLTLRGRLALDTYEEFVDTIDAVGDAGDVLEPLSPDATFDTRLLRDATIVRPDPVSPQRPYVSYQRLVEDAEAVRGFAPVVLEENVPMFRDRMLEDRMDADLTLAPDALEELVSEHADAVEASLDTGRLTLRSATETLEYALMLVEQPERTVACALVYANNGIAGAICNDSPDAVRWTEGVYERLRAEARPLHE